MFFQCTDKEQSQERKVNIKQVITNNVDSARTYMLFIMKTLNRMYIGTYNGDNGGYGKMNNGPPMKATP